MLLKERGNNMIEIGPNLSGAIVAVAFCLMIVGFFWAITR